MAKQTSASLESSQFDTRIDSKIAAASATLQPILNHIREVVHEAAPGATETIKWGMPFFELNGVILANMGIFKQHCSLGFWSKSMTDYLAAKGIEPVEGAGSFGKITSLADLPPRTQLIAHVREAAEHIRKGNWESPLATRPRTMSKPTIAVPDDFAAALANSPKAKEHFDASAPSCRREYLVWITEAKRDETRIRRIAKAVEQLAEGKQYNWQYQK